MTRHISFAIALTGIALAACGDEADRPGNDPEVITTVILTFSPAVGPSITATWNDADGDGGDAPTIDPVNLTPGNYMMSVQFQNRRGSLQEEITDEVVDESDVHLVLFTGTAVMGPATSNTTGPLVHSYTDTDTKGLPLGITNMIMARTGTGQLTVTLRHMPPEEPPVKAADTLTLVRNNGLTQIGGSTDAQVNFTVTVQ